MFPSVGERPPRGGFPWERGGDYGRLLRKVNYGFPYRFGCLCWKSKFVALKVSFRVASEEI